MGGITTAYFSFVFFHPCLGRCSISNKDLVRLEHQSLPHHAVDGGGVAHIAQYHIMVTSDDQTVTIYPSLIQCLSHTSLVIMENSSVNLRKGGGGGGGGGGHCIA